MYHLQRLAEEQAKEILDVLVKVRTSAYRLLSQPTSLSSPKTFRSRLIEIVDQAQHFAVIGAAGAGGSDGEGGQAFREGLDAAERESEYLLIKHQSARLIMTVVFILAQESAKNTKKWYEESDRPRR